MKIRSESAMFRRLAACRRGASAIEYGLLAALIAVALVVVLLSVGTSLSTSYGNTAGAIHRNATMTFGE